MDRRIIRTILNNPPEDYCFIGVYQQGETEEYGNYVFGNSQEDLYFICDINENRDDSDIEQFSSQESIIKKIREDEKIQETSFQSIINLIIADEIFWNIPQHITEIGSELRQKISDNWKSVLPHNYPHKEDDTEDLDIFDTVCQNVAIRNGA